MNPFAALLAEGEARCAQRAFKSLVRTLPPIALATFVVLAINGCAMFHGWAGLGSRQPFAASGSISVPLGK
jgi:hypothetical protein